MSHENGIMGDTAVLTSKRRMFKVVFATKLPGCDNYEPITKHITITEYVAFIASLYMAAGRNVPGACRPLIILLFVYCNWVVTRWQWLFYMYTKYEIGYY